jgi:hypothetical protein
VEGRRQTIRQAREEAQWTKGGSPDDKIPCIAPRIIFHAADVLFSRQEVINERCLPHYLYSVLGTPMPEAQIGYIGLKEYDGRRGKHLTLEAAVVSKQCKNRLIFEPVALDTVITIKTTLRASIHDDSSHKACQNRSMLSYLNELNC